MIAALDVHDAALDAIEEEFYRRQLAPRAAPRSLLEFARSLVNPTGEFKGLNYNPDLHLGQRFLLDQLQRSYEHPEDSFKDFAVVGDTQSGKTWVVQVCIFYGLCELKLDVICGLQDMRAAGDNWSIKLEPAMRESGLARHLPTSGSGSGGGTDIDTIHLTDAGSLLFFGAGGHRKAGGIDGRSVPWAWNDELDSLPGMVINKVNARPDHFFRQGRRFRTSTVKGKPPEDKQSNILAAVRQGTQHSLQYKCVHCKEYTPLDIGQVRADFIDAEHKLVKGSTSSSAIESFRIFCLRCGEAITDAQRTKDMLSTGIMVSPGQKVDAKGRISGPLPDTERLSVIWRCWDNPFKSYRKIATKWRNALLEAEEGRLQDLEDVYHDDFVLPSPREQDEDTVDIAALVSRSAAGTFPRGRVPVGAEYLTAAVDQQKRLLIWQVMAHSFDGRHWIVDWGMTDVCPNRAEPTKEQRLAAYAVVESKMMGGFQRQDAAEFLRPIIIGMDTADWPDIASEWMREHKGWLAIHGAGADMVKKLKRGAGKKTAELAGWFDCIEYDHPRLWKMLWPHSDSVKHELSSGLRRPIDLPGAMMLPRGLGSGDDLVLHLQAERFEFSKDLKRKAWLKTGYRFNDLWDDAYYNLALAKYWETENPSWRPTNATTPAQPKRSRDDDEASDLTWTPDGKWT